MLRPIMHCYPTKSSKVNLWRIGRKLAEDRKALDRIANATGATVNSVRIWTRGGIIPKNPRTAALFFAAVATEAEASHVRSDITGT